jgi:hypothetical protein
LLASFIQLVQGRRQGPASAADDTFMAAVPAGLAPALMSAWQGPGSFEGAGLGPDLAVPDRHHPQLERAALGGPAPPVLVPPLDGPRVR